MSKLCEKLWLWGQDPGTHHAPGLWNLPGENKMTPAEGCRYLGIPNCARVVMCNRPRPPYDSEMEKLSGLQRIIWSVTGDEMSDQTNSEIGETKEVLRLAKKYPELVGGILDDFFNSGRIGLFRPENVADIQSRLHTEIGRMLDLYVVVYEHNICPEIAPYLKFCDVITLWTWYGEHLPEIEKNFEEVKALAPGKRYAMGLYMWDYGNACPYTREQMQIYFELYRKWLLERQIEGVFICSNCIADLGIEAVEWTREWIEKNGMLEITEQGKIEKR